MSGADYVEENYGAGRIKKFANSQTPQAHNATTATGGQPSFVTYKPQAQTLRSETNPLYWEIIEALRPKSRPLGGCRPGITFSDN